MSAGRPGAKESHTPTFTGKKRHKFDLDKIAGALQDFDITPADKQAIQERINADHSDSDNDEIYCVRTPTPEPAVESGGKGTAAKRFSLEPIPEDKKYMLPNITLNAFVSPRSGHKPMTLG